MKKTRKQTKKTVMTILALAMMLAMLGTGCGKQEAETPKTEVTEQDEKELQAEQNNQTESAEVKTIGEGSIKFALTVCDKDGNETHFEISTDKKTVGEALIENNLIEGENGDYGLYIKKVNGIEADFDKDQTYWAFYVDGEYAMSGVDTTEIVEGSTYALKVEK